MQLDLWLARSANAHPDRAAVEADEGSLTYGQLFGRAMAARRALEERGIARGDRVAIALPAGLDFAVTLHACLLLGAAALPVDLRLGREERSARAAGARVVVANPLALDGRLAYSTVFNHDPDAIATVMHTSGTSAAPRSVELTYGNWVWNAMGSALALGLDPAERWLCALPLAHVGGLSILIRSAIYGTTAVLHPRFDAEAVMCALHDGGITMVSLVPTTLERLLDAGLEHPPALRWALLGGAPASPALLERAETAGVPVATTYGLTETCSQAATTGSPLLGTRIDLAPDGEVLVSGPTVAPGALGPDGHLHTGDLGTWDEDGRLVILGRKADTIVSGGENVAPQEVEAVLLAHPDVADAGVFGRPDPEWGEGVQAKVVLRDGAVPDSEALRAFAAGRLARFKVPKAIELVAELPRTASGKLLRRSL